MTTVVITIAICLSMICINDSMREDQMHRKLRQIKKEQQEEIRRAKQQNTFYE